MKNKYPHIFEPITVRRMTVKNRIVMTPMGTNYGEQNGEMSFLHINYYEQRAKGGTGLLIVENASVDSPQGSNGTTQLRIDLDNYIPRLFKLCESVHKHGACIAIQINHAGASTVSARSMATRVCLKSAIPLNSGVAAKWRRMWRIPRRSSKRSTLCSTCFFSMSRYHEKDSAGNVSPVSR